MSENPKTSDMAKYRDVISSVSDPDRLVMPGELVELRYIGKALSLRPAKLLHLFVQGAGADVCEPVEHEMTIEELNQYFHLSVSEFMDMCAEFYRAEVRIEYIENGKRQIHSGPIISSVRRPTDDAGSVFYQFSPVVLKVLENSDHWAALSRLAVLAFRSQYSLRFYEIFSVRKGLSYKKEERIELDDLRKRLGITSNKYKLWADLHRWAVQPAVDEINQLSGFNVSITPLKKGRKVVAVLLKWAERDANGRAQAQRELAGSRVGRKARRDGTVEQIAEVQPRLALEPHVNFPAKGGIRGTAFEAIARANLPAPLPDLDIVASDFLKWTKDKNISLAKVNIAQIFATFCKNTRPVS